MVIPAMHKLGAAREVLHLTESRILVKLEAAVLNPLDNMRRNGYLDKIRHCRWFSAAQLHPPSRDRSSENWKIRTRWLKKDAVIFPISILTFKSGSACVVIERIALHAFCLLSDPNIGYSFLVTILHFLTLLLMEARNHYWLFCFSYVRGLSSMPVAFSSSSFIFTTQDTASYSPFPI